MHQDGKRGSARGGRGRGRGAGRGGKRGRRVVSSDEETEIPGNTAPVEPEAPVQPMETSASAELEAPPKTEVVENAPTIDIEADISQLEAPTFTTITRGPPEPMLRLKWNHKVLLIGEKVLNPLIHSCDTCLLPILLYGRMIPCKHVFCLMCAKREPIQTCPRCKEKVCRVEQTGLGTVFMCTHGGSRYNNKGCRRTYLSQRDLQAHINHRHVTIPAAAPRPVVEPVPEKPSPMSGALGGRKLIGNTPPNMKNANDQDGGHFSSRQHYSGASGGGNWSSGNYR